MITTSARTAAARPPTISHNVPFPCGLSVDVATLLAGAEDDAAAVAGGVAAGDSADGAGGGGGGLASLACTSRWVTTFGGPSVTIVAVSLSPLCRSENVIGRPFL